MSTASEPGAPALGAFLAQYDIGGHLLALEAQTAALLQPLDLFLAPLRVEPDRTPDFRLLLRHGPHPAVQAGDVPLFAGPLLTEGEFEGFRRSEGLLLRGPDVSALIEPARRRAVIVTAPGAEFRTASSAGLIALEMVVDAFGQALVHAAGLTLPDRDALVLLHAPSGTGKTTTALALAGAGFGLCADDAIVLRDGEAGISAWGLPRFVKIHRRTAALLPWLAPALGPVWDAGGEQAVPLAALSRHARIEDRRPRAVAALFMVTRGEGPTQVHAQPRVDALAALAADNVRGGIAGLEAHQARRWALLARLVSATPVFELRVGPDVGEIAARVREALAL
ncbi:serine kinase [Starkeya koreensis]|uniref:Serine kinase n=1 Tax=Ancylobacter koreensis TaxID=266121 RepID=A0ABT0DJD7_9HYPH|nr:serine kinase [Ancylobacter koreensis]MCK0207390.1 serine kinase [Ancylobacter koreensis]